ncbi:MAG: FeoB-associated Cys-rich membrane protein [Oscillospiraceae bacterium]|jgi:hypothetical protein
MLTWLSENISSILIGVVLLAVVAAVILYMVRNRRKGKSSCGCGCAGCSMNGCCHQKK